MALLASDIIDRAEDIYNDTANDRITEAVWMRFLNDALKQTILVRPDSYTITTTMQLASGTKQTLSSTAMRLIDIIRNMGTGGSTPGTPVFYVDRDVLDLALATWHSATEEDVIDNFWYDPKNPTVFYVSPPNTGNGYIELTYSILHAEITATGDSVALKDIFLNPLLSWCLYRAFLVDTDSEVNWSRAQHFYSDFYQSLGIEGRVLQQVAPSTPKGG